MLLTSRHALSLALLGDTAKYPPLCMEVPVGCLVVNSAPNGLICAGAPIRGARTDAAAQIRREQHLGLPACYFTLCDQIRWRLAGLHAPLCAS